MSGRLITGVPEIALNHETEASTKPSPLILVVCILVVGFERSSNLSIAITATRVSSLVVRVNS